MPGEHPSILVKAIASSLLGLKKGVLLQGANQAAAAAKLQHPTYMLGQVWQVLFNLRHAHSRPAFALCQLPSEHADLYRPAEPHTVPNLDTSPFHAALCCLAGARSHQPWQL